MHGAPTQPDKNNYAAFLSERREMWHNVTKGALLTGIVIAIIVVSMDLFLVH